MLRDGSLYYPELTLESAEGPDLRLGLGDQTPSPGSGLPGSSSCTPGPWISWKQPAHSPGGPEGLPHLHIPPTWLIIQACKKAYLFSAKKHFFKIKFQNHENSSPPRNEEEPFFLYLQQPQVKNLRTSKVDGCVMRSSLVTGNPSILVCSL